MNWSATLRQINNLKLFRQRGTTEPLIITVSHEAALSRAILHYIKEMKKQCATQYLKMKKKMKSSTLHYKNKTTLQKKSSTLYYENKNTLQL